MPGFRHNFTSTGTAFNLRCANKKIYFSLYAISYADDKGYRYAVSTNIKYIKPVVSIYSNYDLKLEYTLILLSGFLL
jgi:hypothetical protein